MGEREGTELYLSMGEDFTHFSKEELSNWFCLIDLKTITRSCSGSGWMFKAENIAGLLFDILNS